MLTSFDLARIYNITPTRVRELARARGVGTKYSGVWLFTPEEAERLKPLPVGRPREKK